MAKFQKGQSGNPGGRPKALRQVEELARQHTMDAVKTLAAIHKDKKAPQPILQDSPAAHTLKIAFVRPIQRRSG
jgi:uncharacterized protein DUF5681